MSRVSFAAILIICDKLSPNVTLNGALNVVASGENAELNFVIPDGIADGKFTIGPKTGEIRTNASLDKEEQDVYTLTGKRPARPTGGLHTDR